MPVPDVGQPSAQPATAEILDGQSRRLHTGYRSLGWLAAVLPPVLIGYALFDRAFAYIHVPGTPVLAGALIILLCIILLCIVGVTCILVNAYFDPTLESPQVAIWLWTIVGMTVGLAALSRPNPPVRGASLAVDSDAPRYLRRSLRTAP